jgi:hypothetical protein
VDPSRVPTSKPFNFPPSPAPVSLLPMVQAASPDFVPLLSSPSSASLVVSQRIVGASLAVLPVSPSAASALVKLFGGFNWALSPPRPFSSVFECSPQFLPGMSWRDQQCK